jgi:hypothetical protein
METLLATMDFYYILYIKGRRGSFSWNVHPSIRHVIHPYHTKGGWCFFVAFNLLLLLPSHRNLAGHPCLFHKKEEMFHRSKMCISDNRPKEDDVFSTFLAYCCYFRTITTMMDILACSIKKEKMLHRSEMCISENWDEMLFNSGKKLFLWRAFLCQLLLPFE